MDASGSRCYAFERFHFDPLRGQLSNGGAAIELRPKSLAVLQYLLANPQRLVGKDELLDAVWGRVVVTEDSLVQCVREIREALGDADRRLIRTIPRAGYMLAAVVREEPPPFAVGAAGAPLTAPAIDARAPEPAAARATDSSPPRQGAAATVALRRPVVMAALAALVAAAIIWIALPDDKIDQPGGDAPTAAAAPLSIVVLPLANIDGDPAHAYFADGLTNDLTTDLGRIPTALVISHSSARAYRAAPIDGRKAGRELGARYALEGSVQRLGDQVRVNLRLIDTDSGIQRWAERFEGSRADLPQMQSDIVRRIAKTLEVRLVEAEAERSVRERTQNPDAHDLLMRGWALWERRRPDDNAAARELFKQAAATDPKFSLAWVGIANTHLVDLHAGWTADRQSSLQAAEQAIAQAHAVGPRHRDVNAVRGYVLFFQGSIEPALAAFDQEIEANPGNALAHVWRGLMLISLGRAGEAVPSIERGMALSPRDADLNVFQRSMAHAYLSLGRYGDAVAWAQKAVGHTPSYAKGHAFLAAAAALNGDAAAASNALASFRGLQPKYGSVAAFRQSMMPGELRMFEATPRFWEGLEKAGLPAS